MTVASLAQRIREHLAGRKGIREKRMFGTGFLLNGNLCLGVWKDSLIVRLAPQQAQEALTEPHVKVFDLTGKPMKGWVIVGTKGVQTEEQLSGWIERALQFVRELPAK